MKTIIAAALLVAGLSVLANSALADATGIWRMENGKVTVRVAPCGGNLCGTIIGLRKPLDKQGKPKLDKENPNAALRSRPVVGLTILSNMRPSGENSWKGTIYNPDDGNTYRSKMRLESGNLIKVKGCVSVFCKSMKFVRIQ